MDSTGTGKVPWILREYRLPDGITDTRQASCARLFARSAAAGEGARDYSNLPIGQGGRVRNFK